MKVADNVDKIHRGQIEPNRLREMLSTPKPVSFNEVGGRKHHYKIRGLDSLQNSTAPQTANTDITHMQMPPKTAGGPSKPITLLFTTTNTNSVNETND